MVNTCRLRCHVTNRGAERWCIGYTKHAAQELSKGQEEKGIQPEETTTSQDEPNVCSSASPKANQGSHIFLASAAIASFVGQSNNDYIHSLFFCDPIVALYLFVLHMLLGFA